MADQPRTNALEATFWDLVAVWRAGGQAEIQGRSFAVHGSRLPDERVQRLRRNSQTAREILVGSRKTWAQDLEEAVIDVELKGDAVTRIAGVRMSQRRALHTAFLIDLSGAQGHARLAEALRGVNGLVLRQLPFNARAAVGELICNAELPPSCQIVELALPEETDYRQFIAGSFWIDMNLNLSRDDLFAHALLRALQVRSIRSTALKTHKLSFYAASAVKKLHRDGVELPGILARTGVPERIVRSWIGLPAAAPQDHDRSAAEPAEDLPDARREDTQPRHNRAPPRDNGARAATDRQKAKAQWMVRQLPALEHLFAAGWDADRQAASDAIARAKALHDAVAQELSMLDRERQARNLIAAGRSVHEAAVAAGLARADLLLRLERDMGDPMNALAERIGRDLGCSVRLRELLPQERA